MAEEITSDSSTSESEVSACSSTFNPLKTLYSNKSKIPVENAPMFENLQQFESAQKFESIIPTGHGDLVQKREAEKEKARIDAEKALEEKNKQRFAKYEAPMVPRIERKRKNVFTKMETIDGPLALLKECVDKRLRIKVVTRNANTVRGVLTATLVAFDKQWNLALIDVLEVWKRKGQKKRKVPPGMGTPVPKGTAATISPVPVVTEKPLGRGMWECSRHIPQLMMRGEHVVLINILER